MPNYVQSSKLFVCADLGRNTRFSDGCVARPSVGNTVANATGGEHFTPCGGNFTPCGQSMLSPLSESNLEAHYALTDS